MRYLLTLALAVVLLEGAVWAQDVRPRRKALSVGIALQKVTGEKFSSRVTVSLISGNRTVYGQAKDGLAWIQRVPWGEWTITIPGWQTDAATLVVGPGKPARVIVTVLGHAKAPQGTTVVVRVPGGNDGEMVSLVEKIGDGYGRTLSANISGGRATVPFVPKGKWVVTTGDGTVTGKRDPVITVRGQKQVTATLHVPRRPRTSNERDPAPRKAGFCIS